MDKLDFLRAGYKEFPVSFLDSDWAQTFLQKRMFGELGTKYFINVYFPSQIKYYPMSPTCRLQIRVKEGTVNVELFSLCVSISEMEAFMDNVFVSLKASYYELD